ncbi:MAG TPA: NAD(P)-dependent oxidoreductase [Lachnoclostridium sp.]|nr:NAD(P)-dependent oxidoreductase [Lachnoclostridium sp.]
MKKKIMVTGSEGFLGGRIAAYYEKDYDVIRVGHMSLDITAEEAVAEYIKDKSPDAVIHCAAISNTRECEENPALSEAVNRRGSVNIAKACREIGSRLLFMSSDQIYGGSRQMAPNKETDIIPLINVYGAHKKQAEDEILEILPEGICLRLTWMYDFPVRGLKSNSNLLVNLIRSMVQNRPIKLSVSDYRGITWVQEVVKNIEPAMDLPGGIYNFGSESTLSAYEIGSRVFQMLDRNGNRGNFVIPNETGAGDNPRNLTMDMGKLKAYGISFSETVTGFSKCLEENPEYVCALIGESIVEI